MEAKRKAKKAMQETNGKRRNEKEWENGERQKGKEKRRIKEKWKKARVSGRHYANYLGLNGGDAR